MAGLLKDRVAVITGAGSGIGRAIAILFAKEGAKVIVAEIDDVLGEKTVQIISDNGGTARFIHTDCGDKQSIKNCMEAANQWGGNRGIHILVNNAARAIFGHVCGEKSGSGTGTDRNITDEDWKKLIDVNILGYVRCIEAVVPYMKTNELTNVIYNNDQGKGVNIINAGSRGSIVNISSISGFIAQPEFVPYNMSKGAVQQMTRCCAMDLAKFKIRVNDIAPGSIETPISYYHMDLVGLSIDEGRKQYGESSLLKRQGAPEEIANGALFLASDQSSFMTGAVMVMDGGLTI